MDDEKRALLSFLGAQRRKVPAIVDGLTDADVRRTVLPSGWTCLGLIHHLAMEERLWFRGIVAGEGVPLPGSDADNAAEWQPDPQWSVGDVLALYRDEAARADAIIAATPLGAAPRRSFPRRPEWRIPDLRWVVLHLIQETARHLGHLDAARELLDGRAGLGQ
jgi:hypothetical protein